VAAARGTDDGGGARVAARVRFLVKSKDKIRVSLKMKSREIQILELVLDKIEAKDSKRELVCIRFGHP
jgi:hypothetical protein